MLNFLLPEIRNIISITAIILGFLAFYPYIRDTIQRKAKPHAFSWLIWAILSGSAFVIQLLNNGGFGSYITGFAALMCTIMSILGFHYGDRKYHIIDFVSLITAGIALFLWWYNKDPFYSIILMAIIYTIGFVPTIRKTYKDPYSESITAWNIMILRGFLGIIALDILTFNTAFYISINFINNIIFVLMILGRKFTLNRKTNKI